MSRKASVAGAAWADPLGTPRRGAASAEVAARFALKVPLAVRLTLDLHSYYD